MNLKNLFNKNYFVQNVLKSKAVIALVLGIIPILNAIYIMSLANETNGNVVVEFGELSIINVLGMYVLPVIISLCLFGYLFKRKSVDFINSMPLSRKQIFVTNTIGGILLIVSMMLINTLIILVQTLIFSNLVIPFNMIIDYFVLFTISYIFVFVISNLAATLAGNNITMIILTILIAFFVPFMHHYISGFDGEFNDNVIYTQSADCVKCEEVYTYGNNTLKEIRKENSYTLPYNIFTNVFTGDGTIYNTGSIVKMVILTIVYILLGIILFERRKMEVNETSFKKPSSHFLVKSLTLIPIFILVLMIINDGISFTAALFILVLVITYVIIYDLMTLRGIKNFKLGFVYFVLTAAVTTGLYYGVDAYYNNNSKELTKEDITTIDQVAVYIRDLDYARNYNSKSYGVYIKDKDVLQIIKDNIQNPIKYDEYTTNTNIKLKIKNKEYETNIYLPNEEYENLVEKVANNEEYVKEFKNIDYSQVNAISVDNINIIGEDKEEFLNILKKSIENVDLNNYMNVQYVEYMSLRMYTKHKNVSYQFPVTITKELYNKYREIVNRDFLNKIKNKRNLDIYNMEIISKYGSTITDERYYYGYNSKEQTALVNYLLGLNTIVVDDSKTMVKITGDADTERNSQRFSVVLNYEGELEEILKYFFARGGEYE